MDTITINNIIISQSNAFKSNTIKNMCQDCNTNNISLNIKENHIKVLLCDEDTPYDIFQISHDMLYLDIHNEKIYTKLGKYIDEISYEELINLIKENIILYDTMYDLRNYTNKFNLYEYHKNTDTYLDNIFLSDVNYDIFIKCCWNYYIRLVEIILNSNKIDPSYDNNYAIRRACENGCEIIVKILLQDSRVNPSVYNNKAIRCASYEGHENIVKLLLQDSRVDPSADNNYAICMASRNGHENVVKLLLQDSRVDPSDNNNIAICYTSFVGHENIVKLLLQDSRVNPSDDNNLAIHWANEYGHENIVKLLLQDNRLIIDDQVKEIKAKYNL